MELSLEPANVRKLRICLGALAACRLASLALVINSLLSIQQKQLFQEPAGLGLSMVPIFFGSLSLGLLGVAFIAATIYGLKQHRLWALYATGLIAFLNLMTLCFPFSLAIGWFLLPAEWSDRIKIEARKGF